VLVEGVLVMDRYERYRIKHPERIKENKKKYLCSEKGKEKTKAYTKKRALDGRQKISSKKYYDKCRTDPIWMERRKAIYRKSNKKRYKVNKQKIMEQNRWYRIRDKKIVMRHYSNGELKCALCDVNDIDMLTIDHIYGGGNKSRKEMGMSAGVRFYRDLIKKGFPSGYRVLCWNHQFKESLRLGFRGKYKQAPRHVVDLYGCGVGNNKQKTLSIEK